MKYALTIVFFLVSYGCINRQPKEKNQKTNEECIVVDVEKCLKSKKKFLLSSIADTIEYINLTTPNDLIITKIKKVVMYNTNFFLRSNHCVYQFDRNGMFVRQFGKRGKGPKEYTMAMDFFIDTNENLVGISHYPKLSFYNLTNGEYVKTITFEQPDIAIKDSIIIGSAETLGVFKHRLIGINYKMDTLLTLPNYIFYSQRGKQYGVSKKISSPFYKFDDAVFYKGYEENDTVWKIKNNQLLPHIFFDMGRYKLPLKYEPNVSPENFMANAHKYRCVPRVGEDFNYIYFNINFRNGGGIIDYCALYDKNQKTSCIIHGEKNAGMKDDLLSGPDFWPLHITEEYYISYVESYVLMEYLDENLQLIYEELKKQIQNLTESSNQLLVLCKKKRQQTQINPI